MKITIRRCGGFAGQSDPPVVVNTVGMTSARRAIVQAAVDVLRRAAAPGPSIGADLVHYEVLVEEPGGLNTSSFLDDGSEHARRLLAAVSTIERMNV